MLEVRIILSDRREILCNWPDTAVIADTVYAYEKLGLVVEILSYIPGR